MHAHKSSVSTSVFTVQRENIRCSLLLRTLSSSRLLLAVFFVLARMKLIRTDVPEVR